MIGGVAWSTLLDLSLRHLYLAVVPLLVGLAISLPLGWVAARYRWTAPTIVAGTGLLYTIPSLALFIMLPLITGARILDDSNVLIAMTIYTVALLTRTVADGLTSVPSTTRQAATAMGYGELRRTLTVDLPLAVPVITAVTTCAIIRPVRHRLV